jgi:HEAT repeat protein
MNLPRSNSLLVLLFCLLSACASSDPKAAEGEPFTPPPEPKQESIGFYLSQLDNAIAGWNQAKLRSRDEVDERKVRALERTIQYKTRLRFGELIAQLEAGPPRNRAICAVALGFSGLVEALSPMLSALEDPDPAVVSNALLGLGLLAQPETPLAQICFHLSRNPDAFTRNNAAFAMQRILIAGGDDDCARASAREALLDTESAVRSKAALILYLVGDTDSITALGDLLYDKEPVVIAAAATALAGLGKDEAYTGAAARLMVAALEKVHPTQRLRILFELKRLRGADLGEDAAPWRDWAYRLP